MLFLTLAIQADGPVINFTVGVSGPREQALRAAQQPVPVPIALRGLIDTGADATFLNARHLQSLHLPYPTMAIVGIPAGGHRAGALASKDCPLTVSLEAHPSHYPLKSLNRDNN